MPHAIAINIFLHSLIISGIMSLGIVLLGPRFSIAHTNWFGFFAMYLLTLIFFSTAYVLISFTIPFKRFMEDFWPLIGSPMMSSGSIFFTWKKLYAFSPALGSVTLLNPITFVVEGLRAALLGGTDYLQLWLCMVVIMAWIAGMFWVLSLSLGKTLDPV